MVKVCSKCRQALPLDQFGSYVRKNRNNRTYVYSWCKSCKNSVHDPLMSRKSVLRTRYRMSWEEFESRLAAQGNCCAICKAVVPGGQGTWHIDHDHSCCDTLKTCGKCTRGILCHLCNTSLGCARDDPKILRAMISYLES